MKSIAVFDFDRTIVDDDSDATIIRKLSEKRVPPTWNSSSGAWTPYMSNVFEHAYSAGLSQEDILEAIGSMPPTPGMVELLTTLADRGWDILIITDANSVFVNHWLKTYHLLERVTTVITNAAHWVGGKLYIEHCMEQTTCARCPTNLCKWRALSQAVPAPARVVYAGDGRNDSCPALHLGEDAIVFPRQGYPLHKIISEAMASPDSAYKAKVVPWETADTILHQLFPDIRPQLPFK